MEIIWDQTCGLDHYEVHSDGEMLRLYRNHVHHSQWNPNRPLYGCIWDLMVLPALYRPNNSIKNVLLLGFGAGTVALKLQKLVKPASIVGVELDAVHLHIAEEFFKSSKGCKLFNMDAMEWIQREVSRPETTTFDFLVDDVYVDVPTRGVPLNLEWYRKLAKLTSSDGMLVFNITRPTKNVPYLKPFLEDPLLSSRFPYSKAFQVELFNNVIFAFSWSPFEETTFNSRMAEILTDYPQCKGVDRNYLSVDIAETFFSNT